MRNKKRFYQYAGGLARFGNKVISVIAGLLVLVLVLYGSYSIYNNWQIYRGAYLSNDLAKLKPTEENVLSLEELKKINQNVVGWLTVDGTKIDYPFVQGKDNMEYVNKDIYNHFSLSGTVFMDCRNTRDMSDHYNLLYGHHMSYGAMFGDIEKYKSAAFLEKNHTGTLIVDEEKYGIEFYAFVQCDATDETFFSAGPTSNAEFRKKLTSIKNNSVTYRAIDINENDQVIALSTCSEADTNSRMILFGKLMKGVK